MAEKILHAFPTIRQAICFFDNRITDKSTSVFSRLRMSYEDNLKNRYFVRRVANMTEVFACLGEDYYHTIHHNYDTPELKHISSELIRALPMSMHFPGNLSVTLVGATCTCGVKFTGGICSDWCDLMRKQ